MLHNFGFSDLEQFRRRLRFRARARPARITNRNRTGVVVRHRPKHVHKFIFVPGLHMHPVWDVPEITDIEQTVMSGPIVPTQSGAVHAKRDV